MDLLETLSLAATLEVNLSLGEKGEQVFAEPKGRLTPELRQAIKENIDALKRHLQNCQLSYEYELLSEIAAAGITLRLKPDGTLLASPKAAVGPLREKIVTNRDLLAQFMKLDERAVIHSEPHARLLIRSQFDTEPFEPVPTVDEAWAQPEKAAFFKEGR